MTLANDLNEVTQNLAGALPADKVAVFQAHLQRLTSLNLEANSLKIGQNIPAITLANATGSAVSVQEMLRQGPVVLTFYRGSWCPYCNLQLRALQQILPQIQQAGASLVALSPQTPDNSMTVVEKQALTFEVLSDEDNLVAKQFGLVFQVEQAFRDFQAGLGIDLATYNGNANYELPTPATYVVASDGQIAYASVNSNWTERVEPQAIRDALNSLLVLR